MTRYTTAILALLILSPAAGAAPVNYRLPQESVALKAADGAERVQANCGTCHSLDYITSQPPQRGEAFWQASVTKMIKVYHAPIADPDAAAIAAYLSSHY
jgi:sulfite dehydrogenase (cytochrome) subunit B